MLGNQSHSGLALILLVPYPLSSCASRNPMALKPMSLKPISLETSDLQVG
jgi:hypothetical protein